MHFLSFSLSLFFLKSCNLPFHCEQLRTALSRMARIVPGILDSCSISDFICLHTFPLSLSLFLSSCSSPPRSRSRCNYACRNTHSRYLALIKIALSFIFLIPFAPCRHAFPAVTDARTQIRTRRRKARLTLPSGFGAVFLLRGSPYMGIP